MTEGADLTTVNAHNAKLTKDNEWPSPLMTGKQSFFTEEMNFDNRVISSHRGIKIYSSEGCQCSPKTLELTTEFLTMKKDEVTLT
jgi:hypothetical protein